ncbi:molybdopterin-dependent oxidoreductase [Streptomyces mirabilis]|uniref:molybdopterin-dependent oxidoreductase n=1 Tax=Streptomyces mirabilis TaxID=68239 RepID=UPI003317AC76
MGGDHPGAPGSTPTAPRRVPPGQRHVHGWPVSHYGPVPRFRPERWNLRVFGATAAGDERTWSFEEFTALPHTTVVADLHCATGPTSTDHECFGIAATTVLDLAPPSPDVTHVMAWAEYGYAANLRLRDFTAPETLLATHHNGELLTAEHGFPLRLVVPHLYGYKSPKWLRGIDYLTEDRRGFWEARGYHNVGDPWKEQRYSHQEREGEGPAL